MSLTSRIRFGEKNPLTRSPTGRLTPTRSADSLVVRRSGGVVPPLEWSCTNVTMGLAAPFPLFGKRRLGPVPPPLNRRLRDSDLFIAVAPKEPISRSALRTQR